MIDAILKAIGWRCRHVNTTWPIQLPGNSRPTVSCLACGERMEYHGPLEPNLGPIMRRRPYRFPSSDQLDSIRGAGL